MIEKKYSQQFVKFVWCDSLIFAPERHHSASRGPSLDIFVWCDCSQPSAAGLSTYLLSANQCLVQGLVINLRHVLHQILTA